MAVAVRIRPIRFLRSVLRGFAGTARVHAIPRALETVSVLFIGYFNLGLDSASLYSFRALIRVFFGGSCILFRTGLRDMPGAL